MTPLRSLTLLCFAAFLSGSAATETVSARPILQVSDDLKERAHERVAELYTTRAGLILADLATVAVFEGDALQEARAAVAEAAEAFLKEHPVEVADQGPIAWSANPIRFATMGEFLASEPWTKLCEGALTESQRATLSSQLAGRRDRQREALAAWIGAILERGLCLAPAELEALRPVCEAVAKAQIEQGLVSKTDESFFLGEEDPSSQGHSFKSLLKSAGLLEAVSVPRQTIVEELLSGRRTDLHDYRLEAEFFLYQREDAELARRLLSGCAEAILHREGKAPKKRARAFLPGSSPSRKKFWTKTLQRVLGYESDLPVPPSRRVEGLTGLRAAYVLAALDQRAVLSDEQRETLLPVLTKLAELEVGNGRSSAACTLVLPSALNLQSEDSITTGLRGEGQLSTKKKALVDALFEACTAEQRDVLGQ